jgi:hypothetical protein
MRRSPFLLTHLIWLLVCVGVWFLARHGMIPSGDHTGSEPNGGSRVPSHRQAPAQGEQAAVDPGDKAAASGVVSSVLPASFDFPAGWDACECVRSALGETNEFRRMQKFQRAMQRLTPETAARMQQVFSENDVKGRWFVPEYSFFLRSWGEIDGRTAMEFAVKRGGGDSYGWGDLMRQTLTGWATNDAAGAVGWLNDTPSIPDWIQNSSLDGITEALVEKNPDDAMKFALNQADDQTRDRLWGTLTEKLVYGPGLEKAESWLNSIPDDAALTGSKRKVLQQIVDRSLRGGPDAAAALVSKNATAAWMDTGTVQRVTRHLMRDEPAKADAFISGLPSGPMREAAEAQRAAAP